MALGVLGKLRPRIFSTFGTTRVVDRQPNAPAAFTPVEIPGIHFQRLCQPQGTWFCRKEPRKKSQVTPPGINPGIVRLVQQRLKHHATQDTPLNINISDKFLVKPKTRILFPKKFPKYCLYEIMWKSVISSQFTDDIGQIIKQIRKCMFIYGNNRPN